MCGCLLCALHWETWPATQACALSGNQTGDPLVCRLVLSSLSCTRQGRTVISDSKLWSWLSFALELPEQIILDIFSSSKGNLSIIIYHPLTVQHILSTIEACGGKVWLCPLGVPSETAGSRRFCKTPAKQYFKKCTGLVGQEPFKQTWEKRIPILKENILGGHLFFC